MIGAFDKVRIQQWHPQFWTHHLPDMVTGCSPFEEKLYLVIGLLLKTKHQTQGSFDILAS